MRLVLVLLGHLCVVLGAIGAFTPGLPTTPFLLLAAACYERGSPRFHDWLVGHPRLGPPLRDFLEHGVVRMRAKVLSTALIVPSFAYVILGRDFATWADASLAALGAGVLAFLWTRPSRRRSPGLSE